MRRDPGTSCAAKRLWIALLFAAGLFLVASHFATGLWENYMAHPALLIIVLIPVLGLVAILYFLETGGSWKAWFSSAATIIGTTFFGIIGLFPNMFPSSLDLAYSLTAHNASSSPLTLKIMLGVVIVFVPIVLAYQIWAYLMIRGKVTAEDLGYEEAY